MAKRDVEEMNATAQELPLSPPQDVIDRVKEWQVPGVMLYRAGYWTDPLTGLKEKMVIGKCTSCGETHHFEYLTYKGGCSYSWAAEQAPFSFIDPADNCSKATNDSCICPSCGEGIKAVHIGAFKRIYAIEYTDFYTAAVVRGHYVFLRWQLEKYCDKEGNVDYVLHKTDGMTVIGRSPVRFTGYSTWYYNRSYKEKWLARPTYFSDYNDMNPLCAIDIKEEDTVGTELEKSDAVEFLIKSSKPVPLASYLKFWAKYPSVENLIRSGRRDFVKRVIDKATYQSGWYVVRDTFDVKKVMEYANFKKVKPHEILGVDKKDVALADSLELYQFNLYRKVWQREKVKLTPEEICRATGLGVKDIIQCSMDFEQPITKILRYMKKQQGQNASILHDYWRITKAVYSGAIPTELLYPKELKKSHDRIQKVYKTAQNEILDKNIQAYAQVLARFSFEDEETGLCIRPCMNQKELIAEGKALSHCVASYAESVAKRETSIFFIRKMTKKNIPFYTLEYKDGRIRQDHGKNNKLQTEEVFLFEKKWLEFIKSKEIKKNAGNSRSKKQCTGA